MKEKCARKALEYIQDGMVVSLGGGATIALLVKLIAQKSCSIKVTTPSMETRTLCEKEGLNPVPLSSLDSIDLGFDGCDEADENFNALKSCGGIHVQEKIAAGMCRHFILLADSSKYYPCLPMEHPITIEVLPQACRLIKKKLADIGFEVSERKSSALAGPARGENGGILMDARISSNKREQWNNSSQNIEKLSGLLDSLPGMIGHSLFSNTADGIILAKDQDIQILKKESSLSFI